MTCDYCYRLARYTFVQGDSGDYRACGRHLTKAADAALTSEGEMQILLGGVNQ